jgi:hypothetical protein
MLAGRHPARRSCYRQLGIESMECRVLLSATPTVPGTLFIQLESVPLETISPVAGDSGYAFLTGSHELEITREGGFIQIQNTSNGIQTNAIQLTGAGTTVSLENDGQLSGLFTPRLNTAPSIDTATSALGSIEPIQARIFEPGFTDPSDDGGPINISPSQAREILPGSAAAERKSIIALGNASSTNDEKMLALSHTTSETSLSGEWARSTVFEMEGDEPALTGLTYQSDFWKIPPAPMGNAKQGHRQSSSIDTKIDDRAPDSASQKAVNYSDIDALQCINPRHHGVDAAVTHTCEWTQKSTNHGADEPVVQQLKTCKVHESSMIGEAAVENQKCGTNPLSIASIPQSAKPFTPSATPIYRLEPTCFKFVLIPTALLTIELVARSKDPETLVPKVNARSGSQRKWKFLNLFVHRLGG